MQIRLLAVIAAIVSPHGTAGAQDFRSGLSAYNSGDYARAYYDWFKVAEQADAKAEAGLGFFYHHGLGVPRDDAAAATWSIKAAEKGQAEAQLLLGTLFLLPASQVRQRSGAWPRAERHRGYRWRGAFRQGVRSVAGRLPHRLDRSTGGGRIRRGSNGVAAPARSDGRA
jgi:hypothetical protein